MKKTLLLLLFLGATSLFGQSVYRPQKRFLDLGFFFGLTNYSGDLAEKSIEVEASHLGYGAFARYFFSKNMALKASVYSGTLSDDDANATDPQVKPRSFRFSANLLEFGLVGEWHFLGQDRFSNTGLHRFFLSPYLYLGAGWTLVGPDTQYYGSKGNRKKYVTVPIPENGDHQQFIVAPMGIGLRADINEVMAVGLEFGGRPVFSDYLDGVRVTGNPGSRDWYYFGGATVSFMVGKTGRRF